MSVGKPSIDYLKDRINKAQNDKQAMIYMVEINEKIQRKLKEIEKNASSLLYMKTFEEQ